MIRNKTKLLDNLFAFLLFLDFCYGMFLLYQISMVWGGFTQMFTGFSLLQFFIKIFVHIALAICSIALLFFGGKKVKYVLPTYALYSLLVEGLWAITPNGPAWLKANEVIENYKSKYQNSTENIIVNDPIMYPNMLVYILFLMTIIYVFTIRDSLIQKYNLNLQSN